MDQLMRFYSQKIFADGGESRKFKRLHCFIYGLEGGKLL